MPRRAFLHTFQQAQKLSKSRCEEIIRSVWTDGNSEKFTLQDSQWAVIRRTFHLQSSLVIWPTGVGKSLTYLVPAIILKAKLLILSPLLSLRSNQFERYRPKLERAGKKVCKLADDNFEEALESDVIFATPESISKIRQDINHLPPELEALWERIDIFVADEAHSIVTWGEDFRITYHHAMKALDKFPNDKIYLALTATADDFIKSRLLEYFGKGQEIVVGYPKPVTLNPIIRIEMQSRSDLFMWVLSIIDQRFHTHSRCVVFTSTVGLCNELYDFMNSVKSDSPEHTVVKFTGQLNDNEKHEAIKNIEDYQSEIESNKLIVIGTSALGTGVDFDFEFSIHAGLPYSAIELVQQIGRIGRRRSSADASASYVLWSKDMISDLRNNHDRSKASPDLAKKILNILKPLRIQSAPLSPHLTVQEAHRLFPNSESTIMDLYRRLVLQKQKNMYATEKDVKDFYAFQSTLIPFQEQEMIKLQEFKTSWLHRVEEFCNVTDECLSGWLFRQVGYSNLQSCRNCSTEQPDKLEISVENRESNRLLADYWKQTSISEISTISQFRGVTGKLYGFNRPTGTNTFPAEEISRFIQDFHNTSLSNEATGLQVFVVRSSMTEGEIGHLQTIQSNDLPDRKDLKFDLTWHYIETFTASSIPETSENLGNILVLYGKNRSRQHVQKDLRIISKHFNTRNLKNISMDVRILFLKPQKPIPNPNYKPPETACVKLFQENSPADIAKVLYYSLNYADRTRYQNKILGFLLNFVQQYRFFLLNFDERLLSRQSLEIYFKGRTVTPTELFNQGYIAYNLRSRGSGLNREAKTMILENLSELNIVYRIRGKKGFKNHDESHSGFYRLNPSIITNLLKQYPETHVTIFDRVLKNTTLVELMKREIKPRRFLKIEKNHKLMSLPEIRILYEVWNRNAHFNSNDGTPE